MPPMPPSVYNTRLGENLVAARAGKGYGRKGIGERLMATSKHFAPVYNILSRMDVGERAVRPIELWEMAKVLGVKPESLLPDEVPAREISATLTVEQLASLAPILGIPVDELVLDVAASIARK